MSDEEQKVVEKRIENKCSNINRLKEYTKTLINIPSDNENVVVRIEGAPEGVAKVKTLLLEVVHKMENEIYKDLITEQLFNRNIIGAKDEKMKLTNFNVEVPIYKQNHKFIIGKGGTNIKKIKIEATAKIDLPVEGAESDIIAIRGRKEEKEKFLPKKKILEIKEELDNVITQERITPSKLHNSIIVTKGRRIRSITEECEGVTIKFPTGSTDNNKVSIC
ncbi:vigilin [Nephila pilipes]|uniref:Vigilin n=1 Tax=Nephila pilipes TaxID=299642 RepID=A0A8X6PFD3_NEPPI|nr:vigilin [Nephila pilipes]